MTESPLHRNRDFVLLNAGQLLSSAGSAVSLLAYPLLVLGLTHSPAKAGLVSFARLLPVPLFGLVAGLVADRWDRRAVMMVADVTRILALAGLAAVVIWHPAYWPILVVAFVEGTGDTFFTTAQTGAVRNVVSIEQLPAALSIQQGRSAAVSLAGPPLGGLLYAAGRAVPFVVDAISYGCSLVSLTLIRHPFQQTRELERGSIRSQLREGFVFLWGAPFVRTTTFLYAVGNFTIPATLFVLVVAGREQGISSSTIGLLLGGFSGCILLGSALSGAARRALGSRAVLLLEFGLGTAVVLFLIWPNVYVLFSAILLQAFCLPITDSLVHGYRIARIPDHLLGRVEAVRSTIARSTQPLGPLIAGLIVASSSARAAIAVVLCCNVALLVTAWSTPSLRDVPELGEAHPR